MESSCSPVACSPFGEIRLAGEHCDATISVEGLEFHVHKVILCRCSNYFRALFSSRWNKTEKSVYHIQGTSPEIMRLIIEYIYNGRVLLTGDNVEGLLVAADQFNVMGIVRLCSEFLESKLSLENCISIWRLKDICYCPALREAAYAFILHHFKEVTEVSTDFVELSVNDLKDILEKDELNVRREAAVFRAVLKWVDHDPQNRRQHFGLLLGKVRLALLSLEFFLNCVQRHHYVKDNEECKDLLVSAMTEMYNLSMHGPAASGFSNPLGRPRLPHATLFAIGGWSSDRPTNAIETYDVRLDRWLNVTCEQEGPLAYHDAAYLEGFIYVIGGFDNVDCLSSVKRFDLLQKRWQEVAPMHSKRCYVSVAVLNNIIYAMGGFDGHVRLNTAERYKPETNQWTMIAPMHEQRSDASATTLHGKVYICGGFNGNTCLITAEVYNATTDQWSFIAPMGRSRTGVGVIAYGNEVYAVGGFNGTERLLSAEAYSPESNAWRPIPRMLSARSNFGIEVLEDRLFAVGGFNGFATTLNAEFYDRSTNEWQEVQDMGIHRSALSCSVVPGLLYIRDYLLRPDCRGDNSSSASSSPG